LEAVFKAKHLTDTDKQNSSSVASYETRPLNEMGLFYNAPEPRWGCIITRTVIKKLKIKLNQKHNLADENRPKTL